MKYDTHVEETIDIGAPPNLVYETIIDVTRWGRFSPECTGATISSCDRPLRVGDTFTGHSCRGRRCWTTSCTVTVADVGQRFTIKNRAIGLAIATWSYQLEPLDGGAATRLTEKWNDNRGRLMRTIAVFVSGVRDRATYNRQSIQITLRRLKDHLEQQRESS